MKYLLRYENYNVQDMMSIPTNITNGDMFSDYIPTLKPYYDYMISLTGMKQLTNITDEEVDDYVGFSFINNYQRVMILSDKEKVYMLINKELIPLDQPNEIIEIMNSEL